MTTGCMKANSQRVIITKSGAVTTRRVDDHSPFSLAYNSVNHYLGEKSNNPQRMTFTCGQSQNGKRFVSLSMNEVSTETALDLGDSRNFEAAFDMAENRKSLHEACEKAKRFYMEHILYRNPFPPKNKFSIIIEKSKKVKKDNPKKKSNEDSLHTARTTSSALSLLEGTMSLTSMSSHSQLSATTPSHPINLKTPKKRSTGFRNQPPDSQVVHKNKAVKSPPKTATPPPPAKPKGANDEHRLMNTFNTTE